MKNVVTMRENNFVNLGVNRLLSTTGSYSLTSTKRNHCASCRSCSRQTCKVCPVQAEYDRLFDLFCDRVVRGMEFFDSATLSLDEWAKIDEEDPEELIPVKGTRHPSTRAERRKKTAHAKTRCQETIRIREARKLPYSQMLGKGKRHDHIWIYESAIVETRQKVKAKSEIRDFLNKAEMPEEPDEYEHVYTPTYATYEEYMVDYWFNRTQQLRKRTDDQEAYIRFLESRVRDLEREIGF